jgi:uncharacterized protein YaiL (DUF2058 family)
MEAIMRLTAMQQIMNNAGVAVEGKNDRCRRGKNIDEVSVHHAMRMAIGREKPHQVNDVDDADFQLRRMLP